jgi:hypothetical protein
VVPLDQVPAEVATLEEATPDVAALDDAAAEVIDLGGAEPVVAQPDVAGADVLPGVTGANVTGAEEETSATPSPPVEGYDGYSIPTLRGRLRKFDAEQVNALLDYERATRDRPPYVTLLSNRLAKLTASA